MPGLAPSLVPDRAPSAPLNAADDILGPPLASGCADRAALSWGNQASISFKELDALVNRYGNALRRHGLMVGQRVFFLLDDSPELVAAYLGTMRVGGVAVALNIRLAAKDLLFVLEDASPSVLFVHVDLLSLYREIAAQLVAPPRVVVLGPAVAAADGLETFLAEAEDVLASVPRAPVDPAYWVYSSGTTGRPKAAVHCHGDMRVADLHLRINLGVQPGDRVFTTSKMFFAFALGHSLFGALRCGATVIMHTGWPDAEAIGGVIRRLRPTVVLSVPTMYRNLLREGVAADPAFRGVRHYVSAGEKLPESLFESWVEATGLPILEGYGTSETVFLAIANTPRSYRVGSSGRPLPWAETRLFDENSDAIVAPNTPGRLAIRMGSVFTGYWHQPELSREFLRDGWYFPGDMFSFDASGWWYHHGRADDMLKISGQWVSPTEIEECALKLDELIEVAVVGHANADGLIRLAMFAVPRSPVQDEEALARKVGETLRARLSIYKCPRTIRFVPELPRTPTGKVQKFKLRGLLEAVAA
jgi:benzoate-CoA ligase